MSQLLTIFIVIEICGLFKGLWNVLLSMFIKKIFFKILNFNIYFKIFRHVFKKRCEVVCSSRTDARVHALQSTFHVDVPNIDENALLCDDKKCEMIANLNGNLNILRAAIRVSDIEIVDQTNFEAYRNVAQRSYMYRIAIKPTGKIGEFNIPIEEIDRCFIIEYVEKNLPALNIFYLTFDIISEAIHSMWKNSNGLHKCSLESMIFEVL